MVSEDDSVVLEDESGRIQLTGAAQMLPVGQLSTGIVLAFMGQEDSQGAFAVEDYCLPPMAPQAPLPTREPFCLRASGK